ncbi:uncharacterized protein sas isoform X4 [Penaeus vannamei]|uniref:uncharacterized protein sas isoform X4 n=1 Tax=Penaeus vannamei TaxID=6689 RepID=UPI00387F398D
MFLSRVSLVLALLPCVVWAQLGTLTENSTLGSCECSPACEDTVGAGGCRGRMVARADCSCCKVCAQQEGKPCAEPTLPCDAEFGLFCSPEGVCKAEFSCASDGECPQDRFCLGGVCVDPCPILTPCQGSLRGGRCVSKEHRPVCECPEGTIANSAGDVCIAANGTETGCEHDGRLYAVGETRYLGKCEEQCRCGADGKFSCGPVACAPGLFPAGQHSQEELCIELRNRPDTDECCVVVACVNSLTRPSLLTSPASSPLAPAAEEEQPLGQAVRALSGRTAGGEDLAEPITEEEYQRRLKDLEHELNKNSKKKTPFTKPTEKPAVEDLASSSSDDSSNATAVEGVESMVDVTEEVPQDDESLAEVTTTIPETPDEKGEPAVIVEIDHHGEEVHRITVQEAVDVVTLAAAEEEATTVAPTEDEGPAPEESVGDETVSSVMAAKEEEAVTSAVLAEGEDAPTPAVPVEEGTTTETSVMEEMPADKKVEAAHDTKEESTPADKEEATPADEKEEGTPAEEEEASASPAATAEEQEGLTTEAAEEVATTTPAPAEGEEVPVSFREAKKAPEDANVTETVAEEAVGLKEKDSLSKGSVGGLKVIGVTHNSSTVLLPSTKGGEIYYKPQNSEDWQRMDVEAGLDSQALEGLVPGTQYNVKWSGVSGGTAKLSLDTLEGCQAENVSYGVGQDWTEGCQKKCSCSQGGEAKCLPRCVFVTGEIKDPSCTEIPDAEDPDCCVTYNCKKTGETSVLPSPTSQKAAAGLPKLLVTSKTHSSVTLAWDDFRARAVEEGYVAEYREVEGGEASEKEPWMKKIVPVGATPPSLTSVTIEDLKPNTLYQVRVSIYDEVENGRLADTTETLTVRTEFGCVYGNSSHALGEFFIGCEERCTCHASGDVKCFQRCTLPYFKKGEFSGDALCREQPAERDSCCVIVRCATNTTNFALADLPYEPCTNMVCGPNAECGADSMTSDDPAAGGSNLSFGYCRCLPGYVGDASDLDIGCVLDTNRKEGSCTFKNTTYRPGDVFFDECEYRCSCNNNTEIECEPRCEFPHEDGSETEPGCEYLPDPKDSCCKLRVCNSTSEAATDAARAPSLPSNGCTEGNITYAMNERFYNGCETQCTCMGFGDISCVPRCPPLKVVSETPKKCQTLPDPLDPCCSITVCDEETPDVMKANLTDEERKMLMENMTGIEKVMTMKEMMKNMTEVDKEIMINNMTAEEREMLVNMTEAERKMMNKTMSETEKEMMMKNIMDLERDMMKKNMTEVEMEMMMKNKTAMEKNAHNHIHVHEDGTTHSHGHDHDMDGAHNHTHDDNAEHAHFHTHEDGTSHSHPHDHMGEEHNHTHGEGVEAVHWHVHEDGTNHSHAHGNMEHSHTADGGIGWHIHEDGTNHSHAHDSLAHTHDGDWHVHEDGTNHSHPHGNMEHTHEGGNDWHIHEDGTNHTHAHGSMEHTHDGEDIWHVHKDGTNHSHPLGDKPHSHTADGEIVWHSKEENNMAHTHGANDWHVHEDGTNHSHSHGNMDHTHEGEAVWHVHEDGTNHSHPQGDKAHSHTADGGIIWHNKDGTNHSHAHGNMPHTHGENDWHVHEDGTNHSHAHGNMEHNHEGEDIWHVHEDGTNHSHPLGDKPHSHTADGEIIWHGEDDNNMAHTHGAGDWHVHEDGTNHSHAHGSMPHTHGENEWHVHEDGTNHSHAHGSMDHAHEGEAVWHVHEDGTNHSHPHGDKPHSHTADGDIIWHGEDDNNMAHTHGAGDWHVHEDGTNHSHSHGSMGHTHEGEDIWHVHEDGTNHSHPHGDKPHSHTADGEIIWHAEEDGNMAHDHGWHVHGDGTNHSHAHGDLEHVHKHEGIEMHAHPDPKILEKKSRANDEGNYDLDILEVMAINATAAEIHLAVSDAMLEAWTRKPFLIVLYSPDSLTWSKKNITSENIRVRNPNDMYVTVGELQPSTAYQFRVAFDDSVSSTAKVQLLDGPADLGMDDPSSIQLSGEGFPFTPVPNPHPLLEEDLASQQEHQFEQKDSSHQHLALNSLIPHDHQAAMEGGQAVDLQHTTQWEDPSLTTEHGNLITLEGPVGNENFTHDINPQLNEASDLGLHFQNASQPPLVGESNSNFSTPLPQGEHTLSPEFATNVTQTVQSVTHSSSHQVYDSEGNPYLPSENEAVSHSTSVHVESHVDNPDDEIPQPGPLDSNFTQVEGERTNFETNAEEEHFNLTELNAENAHQTNGTEAHLHHETEGSAHLDQRQGEIFKNFTADEESLNPVNPEENLNLFNHEEDGNLVHHEEDFHLFNVSENSHTLLPGGAAVDPFSIEGNSHLFNTSENDHLPSEENSHFFISESIAHPDSSITQMDGENANITRTDERNLHLMTVDGNVFSPHANEQDSHVHINEEHSHLHFDEEKSHLDVTTNGTNPFINVHISNEEGSALAQPNEENAYLPQPGEENAYLPQPGEENAYLPQPGEENAYLPQPGEENAYLSQPGEENAYLPQPGEENAYLPQPNEENSYLPQLNEDNANISRTDKESADLPQSNQENTYLPEENSYLPKTSKDISHEPIERNEFKQHFENHVIIDPQNITVSVESSTSNSSDGKVLLAPAHPADPDFHFGGGDGFFLPNEHDGPDASGDDHALESTAHLGPDEQLHTWEKSHSTHDPESIWEIPPPSGETNTHTEGVDIDVSNMCEYEGHYYKRGETFYKGCRQSCMCSENLEVYCADIECPVSFGLELIDPDCYEWDTDPDYVPTPPNCCQPLKCVATAACEYMGQTFNNYDTIPREITGCSQMCTCNHGKVTCNDLCAPVPDTPPPELECPPEKAVLITLPGETCCRSWQCAAHSVAGVSAVFPLPPISILNGTPTSGFVPIGPPSPPHFGAENSIAEPVVQALDARTAQISFDTPPVYKGLPGELLVRFTSDPVANADPETWKQEILVPMGTIINHSQWNHVMTSLEPDTSYAMQVVLNVQGAQPVTSPMFTYMTMAEATTPSTTTPLPRLDVNAELYATEVSKTTAKISWRRFNAYELQYIDGVQVKYAEKDKLIPNISPLLHRDSNQMELRDLQPGTNYTVDLVFFTREDQTTQVSNTQPITFMTLPEEDPYEFEIEVRPGKVSSQTAELYYSGVPDPEEKYVNVFRAVYVREDERVDAQTFKIPKTGHEKKIFLSDLKPDVEYKVWLEAYLSNGRKKKSNVIAITTKAGELPKPEKSEVDPSTQADGQKDGYYAALVAVAIIAAIACVGFLGLLVILLRKQSHAKAHINSSRSNAAYDNPSYKTYDMEMNGIKGSGNGATHMDEP